ncbi:MAG: hypothetical protein HY347_04790 [candidate division NC10 bacterium]|nr:hypothetical protein [candidate division NC10 bacterium]
MATLTSEGFEERRLIQRRKLIPSEFASTPQDLLAKRELADYEEDLVSKKTAQ